ncbi:phosphatase PAP2 family protein [Streptomyces sp. Wb2n-11]|uniref:phosphatase PAP2 family protein n=1 Tax=Streptomyces sp. Wb2n-11 TaxID=1030533 RepID=UPI000A3F5189|nr:phosphatase PAP2 family protein [Streptomyces sp. Wb2n-11]
MDSTELYRGVTAFARTTPSWVRHLAEVWTEAGILLFGLLFAVAWWRARNGDARAVAPAVLAPLATAAAYGASELLKTVADEERPCRAVANAAASLVPCPPSGDWSFPSNHATIAGAAAVGLAVAWRRLASLAASTALLMAFSRVFVGVHYPHDVVAGLLLGAVVAAVALRTLARPAQAVVTAMRTSRLALAAWLAGPGPGPGRGLRP